MTPTIEEVLSGQTMGPVAREWSSKDAILYALGIGMGSENLAFTTQNTTDTPQRVVPSFAGVLSQIPELRPNLEGVDTRSAVHASQAFTLHRQLPSEGSAQLTTKVLEVLDKGRGAFYTMVTNAVDADGTPLFESRSSVYVPGAGGYGGERGTSEGWAEPEGPPSASVESQTWLDQPLLYRLNGDFNPLHSDPAFAKSAGFAAPILHGMATYGMACRALLDSVCSGGVKAMSAQFSKPVMPGEKLTFEIWGDASAGVFQGRNSNGDLVLAKGRYEGWDNGEDQS